jgi:hypothetical protein
VLQVHAYEIDLVVRQRGTRPVVRECLGVELVFADSLPVEGLGLLFLEKPVRLDRDVVFFEPLGPLVDRHEPVFVGPLSPIEYVGLM